MSNDTFMDRLRSFLGVRVESPRNDFRNPIWGSDDDDDEGDELYTRHHQHIDIHTDADLHQELAKHMQEMFSSLGGMFGDMKMFFHNDTNSIFSDEFSLDGGSEISADPDHFNSNTIRDFYLKPGYHSKRQDEPKDIDLDGKISSHDISGLLKKSEEGTNTIMPYDGSTVIGRPFCQTIITTSVTKPDGTVETRRIVKNGNEVIEETRMSSPTDSRTPLNPDG